MTHLKYFRKLRKTLMETCAIIQTYGQECPHAETKIVFNKKGAETLVKALNEALENFNKRNEDSIIELNAENNDLFTSDGEGYSLMIKITKSFKIEAPEYIYNIKGD